MKNLKIVVLSCILGHHLQADPNRHSQNFLPQACCHS